jgi:hypothetical protein
VFSLSTSLSPKNLPFSINAEMSMNSFSNSREEHARREVDVDKEEVTFMDGFTFTANRSDYDDRSLEEAEFSTPQHVLFGNFTRREEQSEQRDMKYLKAIEALAPQTEGEEEEGGLEEKEKEEAEGEGEEKEKEKEEEEEEEKEEDHS